MKKSTQTLVGHNLLPHWTSAHVRVVGSRLHEWRALPRKSLRVRFVITLCCNHFAPCKNAGEKVK